MLMLLLVRSGNNIILLLAFKSMNSMKIGPVSKELKKKTSILLTAPGNHTAWTWSHSCVAAFEKSEKNSFGPRLLKRMDVFCRSSMLNGIVCYTVMLQFIVLFIIKHDSFLQLKPFTDFSSEHQCNQLDDKNLWVKDLPTMTITIYFTVYLEIFKLTKLLFHFYTIRHTLDKITRITPKRRFPIFQYNSMSCCIGKKVFQKIYSHICKS